MKLELELKTPGLNHGPVPEVPGWEIRNCCLGYNGNCELTMEGTGERTHEIYKQITRQGCSILNSKITQN